MELYRHNEALGSWEKKVTGTQKDVDEYVRFLRQGSILEHTRSFVCWIVIDGEGNKAEVLRGMVTR